MSTVIVKAKLLEVVKTNPVIAVNVLARRCNRSGNTYNSFTMQFKLSDGTLVTAATGFEAYGYERMYLQRAKEVLKQMGLDVDVDFYAAIDGPRKDMHQRKHYVDDIKSGYYVEYTA